MGCATRASLHGRFSACRSASPAQLVCPGRLTAAAPPGRLQIVQPAARPHRADRAGLRRPRQPRLQRAAWRAVEFDLEPAGDAARRRRDAVPGAGGRDERAGRAAGCATSRCTCCTCCTCMPTWVSGSRCPTSCGPARTSWPTRSPPPTGGPPGRAGRRSRGTGDGVGAPGRPASERVSGPRRAVPAAATPRRPRRPRRQPGPPLLAVGRPNRSPAAGHGQGPGRRQPAGRPAASRYRHHRAARLPEPRARLGQ